ncbi:metal-dependent hydrolase [Candidatus Micrarchaeota archaeon]|nr:metal-dependent hydrolase [Candidatus Micrarchaeota archaeon]
MPHVALAFALAHAFNVAAGVAWTLPLFAVVFLGAILPDVDHKKTRIFKFALVAVAALVFAAAYQTISLDNPARAVAAALAAALAAIAVSILKPRHRGITHHPLAALVFGLAAYALTREMGVAANGVIAYASHYLSDRLF